MTTNEIPTRPVSPIPSGSTSRKWFAVGYNEALHDIADKYAQGGEAAVLEWLKDNAH